MALDSKEAPLALDSKDSPLALESKESPLACWELVTPTLAYAGWLLMQREELSKVYPWSHSHFMVRFE